MIIIPARLKSSRFENKVLECIFGLPMVVRCAKNASLVDECVVACDDESIMEVCQKFHIKAVMTSKHHNSGTERCLEAAQLLGLKNDERVLNLQGDEPFLEKEVIAMLLEATKNAPFMATCAKVIDKEKAKNPNLVKVVLDHQNNALYFSRSLIPFLRDFDLKRPTPLLGHIGIYGFHNREILEELCSLKPCVLEEIEKLEQLRALYYQKNILVKIVQSESVGIDTKEDLQNALKIFNSLPTTP
ncbi:3-deoxy-manno-octulosonate cytidylyltransferase [Helicobacter acinonychis]|uniref:3-deoxy-manno-octulosonate cytidylyltransferase n=1 Tax=Helicobacter acinonychis (strain Sheeba) TaxID=382638 RepID=KDSB_HELAH|nr:3-deoxy-manno-octulosonate cytidylyltransferase [Helicobacter acinonychis]Q17YX7.1 RecName: Full=3-deoxy-manno-octulosonate cytidylyltransferase; AltName: Full=CMP-2-keto-3-deoxyoctulosonic acid synthase; Short=CKS; Short=CMP-KDO synthase [Helicobacter acinonychis str. Sheeba]CAJ99149.1 3-deoxy-manno-octulosonate cytidylyltransferase [Helicobacter acinonychis str. Sheeba]STP04735.1 3-deoxy-manno-octulosonate cytidylyltransferase [Helicobacter acinonychis]